MEAQETWDRVDAYLAGLLAPHDAGLDNAVAASAAAELPAIAVSPPIGKLLQLLARLVGARRILEIGTLGGYSTIWMARGLSAGGKVVTLEIDPAHARVARDNFVRAGVADRVELREGRAADLLQALAAEAGDPFDLVFIDADKSNTPTYLELALAMTRPGGVIVIDNVVREGAVTDSDSRDASVIGIRRALQMLANHPRLSATALQMVGVKGYDGIAIARVET